MISIFSQSMLQQDPILPCQKYHHFPFIKEMNLHLEGHITGKISRRCSAVEKQQVLQAILPLLFNFKLDEKKTY